MVPNSCYSLVDPTPVSKPRLIGWSDEMAERLGLERPQADSGGEQILAGNQITASMKPFAACYGGHQFGNWAGQLGDGRAIVLGELNDRQGGVWELQLKGAGPTPYSRHADGRAVLRSSLREFLASEAMYHLGVPTTRALALTLTGDLVNRDMFYDGNPKDEPGAITARMAPTFVRLGNFEILTAQRDTVALKQLADWTIIHHFKDIDVTAPNAYQLWFNRICSTTAELMVEWLRVGFVHGVMNTDNLSVLGLTIDYGPFGFLDDYDPAWTPNTTDLPGRRYCYGQQAPIAMWNLERMARAIAPLFKTPDDLRGGLELYVATYEKAFAKMMAGKLGLRKIEGEEDLKLITDLNALLQDLPMDMTIFFRSLAGGNWESGASAEMSGEHRASVNAWCDRLAARASADKMHEIDRLNLMNQMNPYIIPRNYLLYQVISGVEEGDLAPFEKLYSALKTPYDDNARTREYAGRAPEWAKNTPGSSTLSCSS